MKVSDISISDYYSDGKSGLREILSISRDGEVRYRIHAAKQEQDFTSAQGEPRSVVGGESGMTLKSFAVWAKHRIPASDGPRAVLEAKARRLKLSASESVFLATAHPLNPRPVAGNACLFPLTAARTVAGLCRKGLIETTREGTAALTPLGAAYLAALAPTR